MNITTKIYITTGLKKTLEDIKKDIDNCEYMMRQDRIENYENPEKTVLYYKSQKEELLNTIAYIENLLKEELAK